MRRRAAAASSTAAPSAVVSHAANGARAILPPYTTRPRRSRTLADGLVVLAPRPEHALQLEELQRLCFPTLADAERFKQRHYLKHLELFPDGQFVVLDGDTVVGATTTLRLQFDFDHIDHTF